MGEGELRRIAKEIRIDILEMLAEAGSGHTAGPLGAADFWTLLYFGGAKNEQDKVVLSAGHYAPVLYATLAKAGLFEKEKLKTLRKLGSPLQGHPVYQSIPGIENGSGSLGQGISMAVGMAMANKLDEKKSMIYCFMGDGEQNEGQVWEAYMSAAKFKLDNLTVIIDRNHIQIDGHTEEIMPTEPLRGKLLEFGFYVMECDGHNFEEMRDVLEKSKVIFEKPKAIILHTMPGKGVSFMENDPSWHGKAPTLIEAEKGIEELKNSRTQDS